MPNDTSNPGWRDHWPTDEGMVMLLRHAAYLHHLELDKEYEALAAREDKVPVSPEARAQLISLIKQARHKAAKTRRVAFVRKAAVVAAIVIICLLAAPTVLFAVSPTFRNFVLDWYEGHVDITIDSGAQDGVEQGFIRYYVPAYIPDGFVLESIEDDDIFVRLIYNNIDQFIRFTTSDVNIGISNDTETTAYNFDHNINGIPAIVSETTDEISIIWHDDMTAYTLITNLPMDTALGIASSVQWQKNIF